MGYYNSSMGSLNLLPVGKSSNGSEKWFSLIITHHKFGVFRKRLEIRSGRLSKPKGTYPILKENIESIFLTKYFQEEDPIKDLNLFPL